MKKIFESLNKLKEKIKSNRYLLYILIVLFVFIFVFIFITFLGEKSKKLIEEIKNSYKPLYITRVEKINPKFYDDKDFFSCFDENMKKCGKLHLNKDISYTGTFLEKINYLSNFEESTTFDNCVGDEIDNCYNKTINESISNNPNPNTCIAYEDKVLRENCIKDAQIKLAISKDDISLCNLNNDPIFLENCQNEFNTKKAIKLKDISSCDRLSQDYLKNICKDNFYFSVALNINDISYCKEAGSSSNIKNCAQNFVNLSILNTKNKNCEKIKEYNSYLSQNEINELFSRCVTEDISNKLSKLDPKTNSEEYLKLCNKYTNSEMIKNCSKRVIDSNLELTGSGIFSNSNTGNIIKTGSGELKTNTGSKK